MPFTAYWDTPNSFVAEFTGIVYREDIMACDRGFDGSENLRRAKVSIWDFLQVDDIIVSADDLNILAVLDKGIAACNNKLLLMVCLRSEHSHLAEKYKKLAAQTGWDIRILSSRSEAEAVKSTILQSQ